VWNKAKKVAVEKGAPVTFGFLIELATAEIKQRLHLP
jgi:hypothetical protein